MLAIASRNLVYFWSIRVINVFIALAHGGRNFKFAIICVFNYGEGV